MKRKVFCSHYRGLLSDVKPTYELARVCGHLQLQDKNPYEVGDSEASGDLEIDQDLDLSGFFYHR